MCDPLSIILVKNGSKGDRLLFRYPFKSSSSRHLSEEGGDKIISSGSTGTTSSGSYRSAPLSSHSFHNNSVFSSTSFDTLDNDAFSICSGNHLHQNNKSRKTSRGSPPLRRNPYAVLKSTINDDMFSSSARAYPPTESDEKYSSVRSNVQLGDLSDKDLSNLLAVNSDLSERKFELKINEVRFVGHPTLMHNPKDIRPHNPGHQTSIKLFNIVFCLNARASHSIVKCFYDLSKRLGIALRHEEHRCCFVSKEMKLIIAKHDEACSHNEDGTEDYLKTEELFNEILAKSSLAKIMKRVYDDVCQTGFVKLKINNWVQVSFCLPQKIHKLPFRPKAPFVEPENIHKCLEAIRPYHAILLLVDREVLVASFWVDASSTIPRLLQVYSPLKSLQTMAADADLTLSQVVEIASHLVYWAAAIVIYPMCESNVYVIAPDAPITSPALATAFTENFQGISLPQTLADFSLPMSLNNPMFSTSSQAQLVELVCWLLKHRLLVQLHTYIYLATYLDGFATESLNGRLSETGDDDRSIKLSLQPYEHDDDDDTATVSDSFSEATTEDSNINVRIGTSPIPHTSSSSVLATMDQDIVNIITGNTGPEFLDDGKRRDRVPSGDTDLGETDDNNPENFRFEKIKDTLSELQDLVKRAIAQIKIPLSIQDIKMFSRLSKYFTGEFHLEEIMYMENLRRSQLMLLLDKFRDVLITVEKEDADINIFKG